MVHIYLPAAYYHLNLDVTKENLLAAGFSAVPAVFLVYSHLCPNGEYSTPRRENVPKFKEVLKTAATNDLVGAKWLKGALC